MNWIAFRKQLSSCYRHAMMTSAFGSIPSAGEIDHPAIRDWGWALTMGGEMNR